MPRRIVRGALRAQSPPPFEIRQSGDHPLRDDPEHAVNQGISFRRGSAERDLALGPLALGKKPSRCTTDAEDAARFFGDELVHSKPELDPSFAPGAPIGLARFPLEELPDRVHACCRKRRSLDVQVIQMDMGPTASRGRARASRRFGARGLRENEGSDGQSRDEAPHPLDRRSRELSGARKGRGADAETDAEAL